MTCRRLGPHPLDHWQGYKGGTLSVLLACRPFYTALTSGHHSCAQQRLHHAAMISPVRDAVLAGEHTLATDY